MISKVCQLYALLHVWQKVGCLLLGQPVCESSEGWTDVPYLHHRRQLHVLLVWATCVHTFALGRFTHTSKRAAIA